MEGLQELKGSINQRQQLHYTRSSTSDLRKHTVKSCHKCATHFLDT